MALLLIPIFFALIGGVISYYIARAQGLSPREVRAAVIGGVVGGAIGGFLTVPALGLGATVTAALATTLPATPAAIVGVATEATALGVGSGFAGGVGQASSNLSLGDPITKDVVPATLYAGVLQVALGPVGGKAASVGILPSLAHALTRVKASPAAVDVLKTVGSRWAAESTTEALTDGGTMVVPMPDDGASKKPVESSAAPQRAPSSTRGVNGALGAAVK